MAIDIEPEATLWSPMATALVWAIVLKPSATALAEALFALAPRATALVPAPFALAPIATAASPVLCDPWPIATA
nr:hypothetical protein [Lysobacter panacisoli]